MKKYLSLAIVALATLVSCQKELLDNGMSESKHIVFSASIAQNETKATLDDSSDPAKIKWEATDKITITDGSGNIAVYKLTEGAGETSATFEYESGTTLATGSTYSAVFGIDPSFPQLYGSTSIPIHMVAPSTDDNTKLSFTADCGVLRLTLTDADDDVTRVEVVGSTQDYVLNCASPVSITSATSFYLVLPAGTYSAIKVYNNTGKVATKSKAITITTNHLLPATSSSLDFEVGTKGINDGHAWVQLWADGPKWAEFNVGATIVDYFHLFTGTSVDNTSLTGYNPLYCTENCGGLYPWRYSGDNARITGWTTSGGAPANNVEDVSKALWGNDWRDPTKEELGGFGSCTIEWYDGSTKQYCGSILAGYKVTGTLGTSIFFPACGYYYGATTPNEIGYGSKRSRIWSSIYGPENPYMCTFKDTTSPSNEIGQQAPSEFALTVRAVYDPTPALPDGALTGVFTVKAATGTEPAKKVRFSKGNLWANTSGSTPVYSFETNQYNFQSTWNTSHVSHFFWSNSESVAYAESYSDGNADDSDVFFTNAEAETAKSNFTVNDITGRYRVLSKSEWQYLFETRTMASGGARYENLMLMSSAIEVESVVFMGVVLFPDDFTDQETWKTKYTTWEALNNAGLVFLPSTGFMTEGSIYEASGDTISCIYWTSTAVSGNEEQAYRMFFKREGINLTTNFNDITLREYAAGIRLVTDVK